MPQSLRYCLLWIMLFYSAAARSSRFDKRIPQVAGPQGTIIPNGGGMVYIPPGAPIPGQGDSPTSTSPVVPLQSSPALQINSPSPVANLALQGSSTIANAGTPVSSIARSAASGSSAAGATFVDWEMSITDQQPLANNVQPPPLPAGWNANVVIACPLGNSNNTQDENPDNPNDQPEETPENNPNTNNQPTSGGAAGAGAVAAGAGGTAADVAAALTAAAVLSAAVAAAALVPGSTPPTNASCTATTADPKYQQTAGQSTGFGPPYNYPHISQNSTLAFIGGYYNSVDRPTFMQLLDQIQGDVDNGIRPGAQPYSARVGALMFNYTNGEGQQTEAAAAFPDLVGFCQWFRCQGGANVLGGTVSTNEHPETVTAWVILGQVA